MTAVALLRKKWDTAVLVRHLVLLALLTAWMAMTAVKVRQYRSEPTSTSTYWEEDDQLPAFSICPARIFNKTINNVLNYGTKEQRSDLFGNRTLLEFFWLIGLKTNDMLRSILPGDVRGEFQDVFGTNWTTSVNYLLGGLCSTTVVHPEPDQLWSHAVFAYHPDFIKEGEAYKIYIHGKSEYWGGFLPLKQTYTVINGTRLTNVIVTTDREVQDNMRRAPCEEDPNYSQATCLRRCFFAGLNCTIDPTENSSKRPCMAANYTFYKAYTVAKKIAETLHKNCSCPMECIRDSYTISTRPGRSILNGFMELHVLASGTRKVLLTTVSYTGYDLAADIGGFLGLFLGWSLFTLFELLQKGLSGAKDICKRRRFHLNPAADTERGIHHSNIVKIRYPKVVF